MHLSNKWMKYVATLITAGLLIAGCRSSEPSPDDGDDGGDTPIGDTYTVSGTITGLQNPQVEISLRWTTVTGSLVDDAVTVTGDGPFTFTSAMPSGTEYKVLIWTHDQLQDPEQRCDTENSSGALDGANVTDVSITCALGYHVSGTVTGLKGVPKPFGYNMELRNYIGDDDTIGDLEDIADNGAFRFSIAVLEGESYNVAVGRQPTNPTQTCHVRNGSGVMGNADVTGVEVSCGTHTIGGTVTGLIGSGLKLSLSAELELGEGLLLDVEMLDVAENGEFQFEQLVPDDGEYRVAVEVQPSDLDQECLVENGEGIAEGDVTNIEVRCPEPKRVYRFDDEQTRFTDAPLYTNEKIGGVLDDSYVFGRGPTIRLGEVAGQKTAELFQVRLDNEDADGIVYSNLSGKTYWIAAETSPLDDISRSSHYTQLVTVWKFRKETPAARFQIELSKLNLLAYHDTHRAGSSGRLMAIADLQIGGFKEDAAGAEPFYSASSGIELRGSETRDPNNPFYANVWQLQGLTLATADINIFSVDDFAYDIDAGVGDYAGGHVALATLTESKIIEIDLSSLSVGAEFFVISNALVLARNSYSHEGGAVAYLRDPAAFEPGEEPGGMSLVNTQGLVMLEVGDVDVDNFQFTGGAAATACPASVTDYSVLEFSASRYQVSEGEEPWDAINVARSGSASGLVTARVTLASDTAMVDTDFEAGDLLVRFGDDSTAPRTLELPIIADDLDEGNETLTLTLDSPAGCAVIGARNTATVTIIDDDAPVASGFLTVGGTVSGLAGSGLTLSNIGSADLAIDANGPFAFPRETPDGISYAVQVASQPVNPSQSCTVTNGTGLMAGDDITDVEVECTDLEPDASGLDPNFGSGGKLAAPGMPGATDIALQADGKIVAVGGNTISRYTADGVLDTSFGTGGAVIVNVYAAADSYDTLEAVAIQPDGQIVVAGSTQDGANSPTQHDILVARYDSQGLADSSFGSAGHVVTDVDGHGDGAYDVLVQPDGGIIVVGNVTTLDQFDINDADFAAVRYTNSGALDTGYGSNGVASANIAGRTDIAYAGALQIDGKLVVTGRVANTGGDDPDIGLVRFGTNGLPDPAFGTDGIVRRMTSDWDEASDIVVQPDGSIVVSGFTIIGASTLLTVARFDSAGANDGGFGTAGVMMDPVLERGRSLALQADGHIIVAGNVGDFPWDMGIVRLNAIGALDTGFGDSGLLRVDFFGNSDQANAVVIQPDGKIVAGGLVVNGTQEMLGIVRVLP